MAQKHYIKDLYENEGLSLREISRKTGHCFSTVQKYAYQEDWSEDSLPNIEPSSYPILGEYIPIIDEWLKEDRKLPRKQRHTMKRIHDRLRNEYGFTGSYTSVKRYVRRKKFCMQSEGAGYLPIEHVPGESQTDFGSFQYNIDSESERIGYFLEMSFPHSNNGIPVALPAQNQECLLEGMAKIFRRIGGVPPVIRFDNMSTAVVKILEGGERKLTEGFARFMLHYRFKAEFCNPAAGNEKGNVENKVGYTRRNAFVPVPTLKTEEDFDKFNERLFEWCSKDAERLHYKKGKTISELWEEDKASLLPLPEYDFPIFKYKSLTVNKTGFVTIDNNKYGISPTFAGKIIQAKIFYNRIELYYNHKEVGRFSRSYGTNEEHYDWTQYVPVLCRKPGAVEHTRFFRLMPDIWRDYLTAVHGKERKSALQLLNEIVRDGNAFLCDDIFNFAAKGGRTDVDSVRQSYYWLSKKENRPAPMQLNTCALLNYNPDLTVYDGLTGGEMYV